MRLVAWLTADKDGTIFLFRNCPYRNENEWIGNPIGCLGKMPEEAKDIPEEFRTQKWEDLPTRVQLEFSDYNISKLKDQLQ